MKIELLNIYEAFERIQIYCINAKSIDQLNKN